MVIGVPNDIRRPTEVAVPVNLCRPYISIELLLFRIFDISDPAVHCPRFQLRFIRMSDSSRMICKISAVGSSQLFARCRQIVYSVLYISTQNPRAISFINDVRH